MLRSLALMATLLCGTSAFSVTGGFQPRAAVRVSSPQMFDPSVIIDRAVAIDTFLPQPFWLAIVAAPRSKITEKVMGPIAPIVGLSLVHLAIVLLAATKPGGTEPILIFMDVFDPLQSQLDGMERLFAVRDFVAEEWPHVRQLHYVTVPCLALTESALLTVRRC